MWCENFLLFSIDLFMDLLLIPLLQVTAENSCINPFSLDFKINCLPWLLCNSFCLKQSAVLHQQRQCWATGKTLVTKCYSVCATKISIVTDVFISWTIFNKSIPLDTAAYLIKGTLGCMCIFICGLGSFLSLISIWCWGIPVVPQECITIACFVGVHYMMRSAQMH